MTSTWDQLHRRALHHTGGDDSAFMRDFNEGVPQASCKCKEHWLKILKKHPPKFGKRYFAWTVYVHNKVNKKLGKERISVKKAKKIWKY